jgi:hypothetical protein
VDPGVLALLIPILAIAFAAAAVLSKMWIRHRERMAMIEAGMHPDAPELGEGEDDDERPRLGDGRGAR